MQFAGIQSKEYADRHAEGRQPREDRPGPAGHRSLTRWFSTRRMPSSASRPYPQYWAGKAKIDDLIFSITPGRLRALGQAAKG